MNRYYCNNFLKGKITNMFGQYIKDGTIQFEKGNTKNTHVLTVNESNLNGIAKKFITSKLTLIK